MALILLPGTSVPLGATPFSFFLSRSRICRHPVFLSQRERRRAMHFLFPSFAPRGEDHIPLFLAFSPPFFFSRREEECRSNVPFLSWGPPSAPPLPEGSVSLISLNVMGIFLRDRQQRNLILSLSEKILFLFQDEGELRTVFRLEGHESLFPAAPPFLL